MPRKVHVPAHFQVRAFAIEIKQGDTWREVARGTTIGPDKEIVFAAVKARVVRLEVSRLSVPRCESLGCKPDAYRGLKKRLWKLEQ